MWLLTYEAKQGLIDCVPNQDDYLCASQSVPNPLKMHMMKHNLVLQELDSGNQHIKALGIRIKSYTAKLLQYIKINLERS